MVGQDATTTALSYSGWSVVDQPLSFTATISPTAPGSGKPSGSVSFYDNGSVLLGTAPVSSNTATLQVPNGLSVGSHSITAVYSGDTNFLTSASAAPSKPISAIATTTQLAGGGTTVLVGQTVTFGVAVAGSTSYGSTFKMPGTPPSGTAQIVDVTNSSAPVVVGSGTLAAGNVSIPLSTLTAGRHVLEAVYAGDSVYAAGTSTATVVEYVDYPTGITLTSSASPSLCGQSLTFTAVVSATGAANSPAPPGQVGISIDGGTPILVNMTNGTATYSTTGLSLGTHSIVASYGGNYTYFYAASQSSTLSESIVNSLSTSRAITPSAALAAVFSEWGQSSSSSNDLLD